MYLQNRVKAFDKFTEFGIEPTEIDIKKCIKYVSKAWSNVTRTTIENCWVKADILPSDYDNDEAEDETSIDILLELKRLKELEEVQVLIDKLDFEDPCSAEEFVMYDKPEVTGEVISDEDILKAVLPNEQENEKEEENSLPTITHKEVIEAYDKAILYLEQQEKSFDVEKKDLKFIKRLKKEALKQQFIFTKQTNLDNFITRIE